MKLIHTGNILLDSPFLEGRMSAEAAAARRAMLRKVVERIATRAKEWPADGVLIAGNLLRQDRLARDTSVFLREVFDSLRPMPIFIATGPADAAGPLSPYLNEAWPANVQVFHQPEWTIHDSKQLPLRIFGRGYGEGGDASSWAAPSDGRAIVSLAWGEDGSADEAPFGLLRGLEPTPHYGAFGGRRAALVEEQGGGRVYACCGAPEPLGFDDNASGVFLEVTLGDEAKGFRPEVTQVECAATAWRRIEVETSAQDGLGDLVERVQKEVLAPGGVQDDCVDKVVALRLRGPLSPAVQQDLPQLFSHLSGALAWLSVNDETHFPEDYESLMVAGTTLGAFAQQVGQAIEDAPGRDERLLMLRVRDVGVAAHKDGELPIRGGEFENR